MILQVFVLRALGAGATFSLGIYLARVLGADGFGQYSFIVGSAAFIATIGQLGSGMALVKLRLGKDSERSDAQMLGLYIWHGVLSLAGVLLFAISFMLLSGRLANIGWPVFLATVLASFGLLFTVNIFQSVKLTNLSMLPQMLVMPVLVGSTVFLLGIKTTQTALTAYIVAGLTASTIFSFIFFGRFKAFNIWASPAIEWWKWLVFSFGFLTAQLGHALLFVQLPIVYGFVAASHDMGIFSAAYKLAATQLIAFTAIGAYVIPHFADHTLVANPARLKKLLAQVIGVSFAVGLPIFIALVIFPEQIVKLFYGEGYRQSAVILPLLAVGVFFHTATGPLGNFLLMNGETRYYSSISISIGLSGLAMVAIAGHLYSPNGAALALSATLILWKSLVVHRAYQLYNRIVLLGPEK